MIKRLSLERFGKFAGARFPFERVTLFIGDNESGKSTVFDALFDRLCAPKGTTLHGKRLRGRYGEERIAEVEFEGEPLAFDADEFLNLYAIDSGDISLSLDPGSSWLANVKSTLFAGGLDPSHVARLLERDAATSGNRAHVRRAKELIEQREAATRELEEMRRRRSELLAREGDYRSGADRLATVDRELAANAEEQKRLSALLEQQRAIQERTSLRTMIAALERTEALRRDASTMRAFAVDEGAQLAHLEEAASQAEASLAAAAERRRASTEAKEKHERRVSELAARGEAFAQSGSVAAELRRTLETRKRPAYPSLVLWIVVIGLTVLGAAAGALLLPALIGSVPAAFGALAGGAALLVVGIALLLALRAGGGGQDAVLRSVRDEYRRRLGDAPPLRAESYEGMIGELASVQKSADDAQARVAEARAEGAELEAALRATDAAAAEREAALRSARQALAQWLREHGVATSADYTARLRDFATLQARMTAAREEVASAMRTIGVDSEETLRAECLSRIAQRDRIITSNPLSEAEIRSAELQLERLRADASRAQDERGGLIAAVSGGLGEVRGSVGDLPARILAAERNVAALGEELRAFETKRAAAAMAHELFTSIAEGSELLLTELAEEIGRTFGELLGEARAVSISRLDIGQVAVVDAGGARRPIDDLSQGTRDSFLFAARLTLAARSRSSESVIVLDDPFLSFDAARTAGALRYLARFQQQTGWQVVLFTKNPALEPEVRRLFARTVVHHLK